MEGETHDWDAHRVKDMIERHRGRDRRKRCTQRVRNESEAHTGG